MKQVILIVVAMAVSALAYSQKFNPVAGSEKVYEIPDNVTPAWSDEEPDQCLKIRWLEMPDGLITDKRCADMVDAYNALMIYHSVYSDYEYSMRHEIKMGGMRFLKNMRLENSGTLSAAIDFIDGMYDAQYDEEESESVDVNEVIYAYLSYLSGVYKLEVLMGDENVFDERVYADAVNHDSLRNDAFSRRCVDAVELAHDTVDGMENQDALPRLVEVLTAGQYSPLLTDVWKTWRAMVAMQMGHSKDSYIPNAEYNQLRMAACHTTLRHCMEYPEDWVAVNNFLLLASEPNVGIYGAYSFGNQSVMVFYEMFPELWPAGDGE